MRAELPWNVAGIPPEAREAARAAARREGLSVGEWLTRRILRSFSGVEEEALPLERSSYGGGAGMDPWGLPQSSASRRDTEDMLARVSRSESESSETYRRIEDQLRGVARRLDSSERSQSENNRVLSKTAAEINVATREQAQAVDQLSNHLMMLSERLERVERSAAQDGLKDAVKGLHHGLSRLADQVAQAATQSGHQVGQMAGNMEQLATRLDQVRADIDSGDRPLEQRLAAVEKSAHFNTNALDHALEKIEAQANQRAGDMVEAQRRATQTEESLIRLEEAVARLDMRGNDPAVEQRMAGIERSLTDVLTRLPPQGAREVEDTVDALAARLDTIEKNHREMLDELRARQQPQFAEPLYAPATAAIAEAPPFPQHAAPQPATEPPPFDMAPEASTEDFTIFADPTVAEDDADPFAPVSEFVDPFAVPADAAEENENFLTAARRSARAAAEAAQAEQAGRFAGFRLSRLAASGAASAPRGKLLVPLVVALTVVLALAAGIVISARLRNAPQQVPAAAPQGSESPANPTVSLNNPPAEDQSQTPFVVAPPGHVPAGGPPRQILPLQERPVRNAPINPVPGNAPQQPQQQPQAGNAPSLDRVVQLANAGQPIAATVIGLRFLDGNGVAANPGEAFKWLSKAAEAGQAVAQYRLGTMYERGQGMAADPAKAAHWYELSANQGNRKAMHNLAVANASGAMGKKNMAEAARWFSRAAGLGLSDSQFNLAVLYERGDGVPQSLLDAYKWYLIAAGQGDAESKQRLQVLATQLGDADKAAATRSASSFHAAPLSRSANVPPDVADVPAN